MILSTIKFYELLPHWPIITEIGQLFCNDEVETQKLCAELFFAISGPNEKQLNKVSKKLFDLDKSNPIVKLDKRLANCGSQSLGNLVSGELIQK